VNFNFIYFFVIYIAQIHIIYKVIYLLSAT